MHIYTLKRKRSFRFKRRSVRNWAACMPDSIPRQRNMAHGLRATAPRKLLSLRFSLPSLLLSGAFFPVLT
ncbi:hypothetical protein A3SI_15518 [Nitritalea halalkaliphila LW7]|uniref:Uncharacterized protein n=1 Tax=Nitritalea halalkaliphila LW7 TaxID=1189621 RepID=I5BYE7_9BACT|nr:hypothetical protein A3SI_15518 [Nitritalea halalkaliphila LW7]